MKFKKIIVALMMFISIFSFVGCQNRKFNSPAITISRYFDSKVVSRHDNKNYNLTLSSFIGDKADTDAAQLHRKLTFSGITNWLYNMEIEAVSFYFYSTKSIEINQLLFTMTALDGGISDDQTQNAYKVEENLAFNAKKNEGVYCVVNIGHKVTLNQLEMTLELNDENLINVDFDWTIYGLKVYGDM